MKFRRIAFVTFRAAEAQVANETVVVMTPAPQYAVPPLQSALEYALQPERITVPIVFVPAPQALAAVRQLLVIVLALLALVHQRLVVDPHRFDCCHGGCLPSGF